MSDNREHGDRPASDQQPSAMKVEQIRNIPGGTLVRTLPPQQRVFMAPVQSTALISSTTTIQAQVLPKANVQGGRLGSIPMQSTATSTSAYHVPKGPAAVANITVPRSSNVANPIRGASIQAITVTPHSIAGNAPLQIGRPVVSSVAPWVGIPSQQGGISRQSPAQIRPTIQQISDASVPSNLPLSIPYPRKKRYNKAQRNYKLVSYESSSSGEDSDSSRSVSPLYTTSRNRLVSYHSSGEDSDEPLSNGTKISSQIRPLDNQRMLVHSSTTHKQVITQQAQVQLAGSDPSKAQTTVLKSYGGASTAARLVAPPNAPSLSRIATIPSAMAVSLHSAAAVLVPNSQLPLKTTIAQPKVITQPVHSSTSVQFPTVSSATVQSALALNTVQVSRPALVTVMLSPSVPTGGGSGPPGVTHIKSHSQGGPPQLIQQSSAGSQGSSTISKLYTDGQHTISTGSQPVFIQTQGTIASQVSQKAQHLPAALIVREPARSKDESGSSSTGGINIHGGTVFSLTSGSYYDGQGYIKVPQQHQPSLIVQPPSSSQQTLHLRQSVTQIPISSSSSLQSQSQGLRMNPTMVVETGKAQIQQFTGSVDSSTSMVTGDSTLAALALTSQALKQTTSPRPSILRKREPEGSPIKMTKTLAPVLKTLTLSSGLPLDQPPSPKRPESGQSSSGSTTESAHSSPGESPTPAVKQETMDDDMSTSTTTIVTTPVTASSLPTVPSRPAPALIHQPPTAGAHQSEMSPRKKPRKQQLSGNQIASEPTFSEDEMEFITEDRIKKEIKEEPAEEADKVVPKKTMSLMSSYKHNWKGRHNHFNRYTDVKPKEERKPTLSEIANQKNVVQKLTGWKIYHIASHLEDLANNETEFFSEYNTTLNFLEEKLNKCRNREMEKDIHRVTERVRANFQRSRVVKDHMVEAKAQLFKLLEHKTYISDIINRNTIKRPLKKRERV